MDIRSSAIVEQCVDGFLSEKGDKKPFFVAVTGDSGSGKSYYSDLICKELAKRIINFTLVNHDDFLIARAQREPLKQTFYKSGEFKGKSHYDLLENMFHLRKFKKVVKDLRNMQSSRYYPYSRATGDVLDIPKIIEPNDVIIFDTSMLIDLFDYIILIDVDRNNILNRKVKRDSDIRTPEEVIEMHQRVQGYYWDRNKPKNPNIVIDNNDVSKPQIARR